MATAADIVGWWDLSWSGGTFPVCFRPAGLFFCPSFQAAARWALEGDVIRIDWAKFGRYELKVNVATQCLEGSALPRNDADPNNWRKATYKHPLTPVDRVLLGDGAGSEWDFEWSGGRFEVQFKADGYNHFICQSFPSHSHWSCEGSKILINWGQHGNYELLIDPEAKFMQGCLVGGNPATDWRKARLLRNLPVTGVVEQCDQHH
mmetsp:Transcript_5161/g.8350  ORF Transcript_5161/g.8350 Transcript_5161/m.8350 type:complete len:205 (+) Transcript_5161:38-652(+)